MNNSSTCGDNSLYRFRLMSDKELLNQAIRVYDAECLANNEFTLDSAMFGSSPHQNCSICHNRGWDCPGHYALIELPFPIPKFLCHDDWKKCIECICPICSHIIIEDVDKLLLYPPKER